MARIRLGARALLSFFSHPSPLRLFDTDILSAKARQAGFTLAVYRDLYIHHFGTRTFIHGPPAEGAGNQKSVVRSQ